MEKFREIFEATVVESREAMKNALMSEGVDMKGITKMFKGTKPGTVVKLRVTNPKSRSGSGYVTLMDIKGDRLLTTSLATSRDKSGDFSIEDVISYDLFKA